MIAAFIDNENPQKPYSDQSIVKLLNEKDVKVARRTVAKYREKLGILPTIYDDSIASHTWNVPYELLPFCIGHQ